MDHVLLIKGFLIPHVRSDRKTLDIRVGWPNVREIQINDTILYQAARDQVRVRVLDRYLYTDFDSALGAHDANQILPGYSARQIVPELRRLYSEEREAMGVYIFAIKYFANLQ